TGDERRRAHRSRRRGDREVEAAPLLRQERHRVQPGERPERPAGAHGRAALTSQGAEGYGRDMDAKRGPVAPAYEPSPVKRRRTQAELERLDDALIEPVRRDRPTTTRHTFYVAASTPGLGIPKDDSGADCVQRELLKLRRAGKIPYPWITDNT